MRRKLICIMSLHLLSIGGITSAGSLTPPGGAPAATMKTLSDVEPRTAIRQSMLPLFIGQAGSYYFAEDLTFALDSFAITLGADNITIDLNGYTLTGPGRSVGTFGKGIANNAGTRKGVRIMNGTVQGFRLRGIEAGHEAVIERVTSRDNGVRGIDVSDGSTVRNCNAVTNGSEGNVGFGIVTGLNSVIESCTSTGNGAYTTGMSHAGGIGILAGAGSTVRFCKVSAKSVGAGGVKGISAGANSLIENNTITDVTAEGTSTADGIFVNDAGRIIGNQILNIQAVGSIAVGINTFSGNSDIRDNHIRNVTAFGPQSIGIGASANSRVENNNLRNILGTGTSCSAIGINVAPGYVMGNSIQTVTATGTGYSAGIQVFTSALSRVEDNHIAGAAGGTSNLGIRVLGSDHTVTGNQIGGAATAAIRFEGGSTGSYAAANIMKTSGIIDNGANTIAGTVPAPNQVY